LILALISGIRANARGQTSLLLFSLLQLSFVQLPHAVDFKSFLLEFLSLDFDLSHGLFFFAPENRDIVLLQVEKLGLLRLELP